MRGDSSTVVPFTAIALASLAPVVLMLVEECSTVTIAGRVERRRRVSSSAELRRGREAAEEDEGSKALPAVLYTHSSSFVDARLHVTLSYRYLTSLNLHIRAFT
jgi:hypothetical protein